MFKRYNFLFLSVFLHLIVLYVVAQSVMFPSESDSPKKKPDVIQATLIFELPLPVVETPVEVIEQEKPQAVEPEEPIPVEETPEDSQIEPIAEPKVQAIPIPAQPEEPLPKTEEDKPEEPMQNNEILIMDKNNTAKSSSEMRSPVTSMAKRHLSNFQQQQRNKVAEQASRYYQQHKNSPVLDNEVENPFMSEDEKLRDTLKVRADCSSAGKKTTAVLLGFFGGQIDCSKPPPINSFIQDRINKKSQLPKQQKNKKRPQSVVIKKQP